MAQPHSEQQHAHVDAFTPLPDHARVVAVGASAGGLQALGLILAALPADFPAPVLVVQHLSPDFPSQLAHLLGRHTPLHVKQAEQGDRLQAGWVYVAPPGQAPPGLCRRQPRADPHPQGASLPPVRRRAAHLGGGQLRYVRAVGVILTGGDGDGAAGIQAVKAAGGVTLAQDQPSSLQPSMPRNAAATGDVDYVLPLADIAAALVSLTGPGDAPQPGRGTGSDSGDASKEERADRAVGTDPWVPERRCARREGVVELLTRRKAVAAASEPLAESRAELAACRKRHVRVATGRSPAGAERCDCGVQADPRGRSHGTADPLKVYPPNGRSVWETAKN